MGNKWDDMREAYREAQATIQAADMMISDMAAMICGRLRQIDSGLYKNVQTLRRLKRELNDFNMKTNSWRR